MVYNRVMIFDRDIPKPKETTSYEAVAGQSCKVSAAVLSPKSNLHPEALVHLEEMAAIDYANQGDNSLMKLIGPRRSLYRVTVAGGRWVDHSAATTEKTGYEGTYQSGEDPKGQPGIFGTSLGLFTSENFSVKPDGIVEYAESERFPRYWSRGTEAAMLAIQLSILMEWRRRTNMYDDLRWKALGSYNRNSIKNLKRIKDLIIYPSIEDMEESQEVELKKEPLFPDKKGSTNFEELMREFLKTKDIEVKPRNLQPQLPERIQARISLQETPDGLSYPVLRFTHVADPIQALRYNLRKTPYSNRFI